MRLHNSPAFLGLAQRGRHPEHLCTPTAGAQSGLSCCLSCHKQAHMGASVLGGMGPRRAGTRVGSRGEGVSARELARLAALNRQHWAPALRAPPPSSPPSHRPDKQLLSEGQPSAPAAATSGLTQTPVGLFLALAPFPKMVLSSSVLETPTVSVQALPSPAVPVALPSKCFLRRFFTPDQGTDRKWSLPAATRSQGRLLRRSLWAWVDTGGSWVGREQEQVADVSQGQSSHRGQEGLAIRHGGSFQSEEQNMSHSLPVPSP